MLLASTFLTLLKETERSMKGITVMDKNTANRLGISSSDWFGREKE